MRRPLALAWLLAVACSSSPVPVAPADAQVRIVRLEHVQADLTAEILIDVLGSRCHRPVPDRVHAGSARPAGPGVGELKVATKPDQNAVVLSGSPEQLREAMELIARLDVPGAR